LYSCLLLVMLVCLPPATLFPYTTLFRSAAGGRVDVPDLPRRGAAGVREAVRGGAGSAAATLTARDGTPNRLATRRRRVCDASQTDRKSTRLNSSHLVTSYAVFCLKKKKH